jgi:hypothetical protein
MRRPRPRRVSENDGVEDSRYPPAAFRVFRLLPHSDKSPFAPVLRSATRRLQPIGFTRLKHFPLLCSALERGRIECRAHFRAHFGARHPTRRREPSRSIFVALMRAGAFLEPHQILPQQQKARKQKHCCANDRFQARVRRFEKTVEHRKGYEKQSQCKNRANRVTHNGPPNQLK